MKRIGVLSLSVSLALLLAAGVALAAVINGTAGDDTLDGTDKSDSIYGYEGNDTINGYVGSDQLWGGSGSDRLYGGTGKDTLQGEGGDDNLYGQGADDELRGADGKDVLTGGGGNDRLYDRDGNAAEVDTFNCGSGIDTVRADPTDRVGTSCENVNSDSGQDLLPDLGMGRIGNIQITDTGNQKRLRFDSIIVNIGAGKFEVTGRRPNTSTTDMTTTQRIYDSNGDYRDRSTVATFFYAGDGHSHWHVRDLEDYTLSKLDSSGNIVGSQPVASEMAKMGFCFFDNENWGATTPVYYTGCENGNPGALAVTMGLSRGWGDNYAWNTTGQYLDITGLPDGNYRLRTSADESDRFLEEDETNNVTSVDIQIQANTVTVLSYGPSAQPIN